MKLSELRPCDNCGGPLGRCFRLVRFTLGMLTPAARQTLGTIQIVGNVKIGEALAPGADDAVLIAGDKDRRLTTEIFLCENCAHGEICLGALVERRNQVEGENLQPMEVARETARQRGPTEPRETTSDQRDHGHHIQPGRNAGRDAGAAGTTGA